MSRTGGVGSEEPSALRKARLLKEAVRKVECAIEYEGTFPILVLHIQALEGDLSAFSNLVMNRLQNAWLDESSGKNRLIALNAICKTSFDLDTKILAQVEDFSTFRYAVPKPPSDD